MRAASLASRSQCAHTNAHSSSGLFMSAKKAVNVSIQSELLDAARAQDINLSATLEAALVDQLRIRRRARWLTEHAAAIETPVAVPKRMACLAITPATSNLGDNGF